MPLQKEIKTKVISKFKTHESDTGSAEVQIALITERINQLVSHLKKHKSDHSSRRGLLILVGQRKGLMDYLKRSDVKRYDNFVSNLKLK